MFEFLAIFRTSNFFTYSITRFNFRFSYILSNLCVVTGAFKGNLLYISSDCFLTINDVFGIKSKFQVLKKVSKNVVCISRI